RGQRRRCNEEFSELRKEMSALSSLQDELYRALSELRLGVESVAAVASGALPEDCSVAKKRGAWGPFQMIAPPGVGPRMVRCDMTTEGGGWTVALWREPDSHYRHHSRADGHGGARTEEEVRSVNSFPIRSAELNLSALRSEKDPDRPNRNDLPSEQYPPASFSSSAPNTWHWKHRQRRSQSPKITREMARESFNRTWLDYKDGFGHHTREYWIGNDVLHALTSASREPWEALILLKDFKGQRATAAYGEFRVSDESTGYRLHADKYEEKRSSAGDGLAFHHQRSFSTYDRDNDEYHGSHCGLDYGAGWWFHQCHVSLLTGAGTSDGHEGTGGPHTLHWRNWRGEEALRSAVLMIRPK
ncbi:Fibrinogen alpha/beta/gamma chain C-terminal globular domain, partial [Trinorchestia longiramus]